MYPNEPFRPRINGNILASTAIFWQAQFPRLHIYACSICPVFKVLWVVKILEHLVDSHVRVRVRRVTWAFCHSARGELTFRPAWLKN